jgi:hypothetical protein
MGRNEGGDVPVVDLGERVVVNSMYDVQNTFRYLSFTWTPKPQAVITSIRRDGFP